MYQQKIYKIYDDYFALRSSLKYLLWKPYFFIIVFIKDAYNLLWNSIIRTTLWVLCDRELHLLFYAGCEQRG